MNFLNSRHQGVGYWTSSTKPMGSCVRQADDAQMMQEEQRLQVNPMTFTCSVYWNAPQAISSCIVPCSYAFSVLF